jgi:hypothetical protein
LARRYYRRPARQPAITQPSTKKDDEAGCIALIVLVVAVVVWYWAGNWITSVTFPHASGFCAFLLGFAAPVILLTAGLLIWGRAKFTSPQCKALWIGSAGAAIIYASGVALDGWQAEQARQPKQWVTTWAGSYRMDLVTSWDDGQLQYRLKVGCGSAYSLSGENVLIDFLNGESRKATVVVRTGQANAHLTASMTRGQYLAADSWSAMVYPYGKSARCSDGWFSESSGRGTCSHHGGVSRLLP